MKTHLMYLDPSGEHKLKSFKTKDEAEWFLKVKRKEYGRSHPTMTALFTGKLYRTYLYDREKVYA